MSIYLDPDALAMSGDDELDRRPEVQDATSGMIRQWVIDQYELTDPEVARLFGDWFYAIMTEYNEDGPLTNREVIQSGLVTWRGYD